MSINKNRAFSLIEVLLACTLMLLGLALAVQIFVPLGRTALHTNARAAYQQEAAVVLRHVHNELAASNQRGLQSSPPFWRIQVVKNLDPSGAQLWDKFQYFYRLKENKLVWFCRDDPNEILDPALSPAELAQVFEHKTTVQLADEVKSFELRDAGDGTALVQIQVGSYRLCESRPWRVK